MKTISFPLDILDIPQVKRLRAAQYGLFARLVFDYWLTGLPVPKGDCEVVALANSDLGTWQRNRGAVQECLMLVMPELEKLRLLAIVALQTRQRTAKNARDKGAIKRYLKKRAIASLSDEAVSHTVNTVIPPPHMLMNEGKFDPHARASAIKSNKKSDKKLLTDK